MTATVHAPGPRGQVLVEPIAAEPPGPAQPAERTRAPRGLVVVSVVIALCFAAPLVYLVIRTVGFGSAALDVLGSDTALGPLARTLVLAAACTVACAAIGTAAAWLVMRTNVPGRRVLRVLLALPLVIPSFVGAFALTAAFAPGGLLDEVVGFATPPRIEGFWGAFVVLTLLSYPYVYLPVAARLASLPPSLEESARSLGRRPREVFRTVVLPQCRGAVTGGALLVFLYAVSDFGAVSLVRYDTLTLRIDATRLFDRTTSITLSLLLGVVALAVVLAERRWVRRRGVVEAVGAGRRTHQTDLGRLRPLGLAFVGFLAALALVAPVAVLAQWAVRGLQRADRFSGPAVDVGELGRPLLNTALISTAGAAVTLLVVLPVAYLTMRYRSRANGPASALVVGGFALPGLVVALALVFWVLQTPAVSGLYQTYPLLVVAYVIHFGAQGLRASQEAVAGLPRRVEDAARSLGAGRLRRLVTVELPLVRPGLAAAGGLVLLACMKELPATLLLSPIGFETLATRIWSAAENGFLARAGLASLALIALSALLTWLLTIRRLDRLAA